jgi:hypothetical protein
MLESKLRVNCQSEELLETSNRISFRNILIGGAQIGRLEHVGIIFKPNRQHEPGVGLITGECHCNRFSAKTIALGVVADRQQGIARTAIGGFTVAWAARRQADRQHIIGGNGGITVTGGIMVTVHFITEFRQPYPN